MTEYTTSVPSLVVLNCTSLSLIVLHFNIKYNVQYFPILFWQKWTKYLPKV